MPSPNNVLIYKKYRNKLHHLIRIAKKNYYKDKFTEAHKNVKQTWNLINEVINKRKSRVDLPKSFNQEGIEISDPAKIAGNFNEYFVNVGPNLAVLPCFSKIIEKLLFKRLISFIEKHKILYQGMDFEKSCGLLFILASFISPLIGSNKNSRNI